MHNLFGAIANNLKNQKYDSQILNFKSVLGVNIIKGVENNLHIQKENRINLSN